jgi:hypothetical protein
MKQLAQLEKEKLWNWRGEAERDLWYRCLDGGRSMQGLGGASGLDDEAMGEEEKIIEAYNKACRNTFSCMEKRIKEWQTGWLGSYSRYFDGLVTVFFPYCFCHSSRGGRLIFYKEIAYIWKPLVLVKRVGWF